MAEKPKDTKERKERVVDPLLKARRDVADAQAKVDRLAKYAGELLKANGELASAKDAFTKLLDAEVAKMNPKAEEAVA